VSQKREALGEITSASPHRIKINRTSLDHLLLGKCADIDKVPNSPSMPEKKSAVNRFPLTVARSEKSTKRKS
jgi:hypothetical protein